MLYKNFLIFRIKISLIKKKLNLKSNFFFIFEGLNFLYLDLILLGKFLKLNFFNLVKFSRHNFHFFLPYFFYNLFVSSTLFSIFYNNFDFFEKGELFSYNFLSLLILNNKQLNYINNLNKKKFLIKNFNFSLTFLYLIFNNYLYINLYIKEYFFFCFKYNLLSQNYFIILFFFKLFYFYFLIFNFNDYIKST